MRLNENGEHFEKLRGRKKALTKSFCAGYARVRAIARVSRKGLNVPIAKMGFKESFVNLIKFPLQKDVFQLS